MYEEWGSGLKCMMGWGSGLKCVVWMFWVEVYEGWGSGLKCVVWMFWVKVFDEVGLWVEVRRMDVLG